MAKEKIVVIDDSPIVRKLAELALEEEGYKVYTAEDGEEGLRISEEVRPSVILVDFIMPRISGYQFCKTARENELLKDIPIILITGKGEDVGKKFAEKFGVVDYFIKPFKSEMLVEKVNSIVNAQRQMLGEESEAIYAGEAASEQPVEHAVFSFEETGGVEGLGLAASELPALPEATSRVFDGEEEPIDSAHADAETIEEVPAFSFDAINVQEEQDISLKAPVSEMDLRSTQFDFNLEELTAQDIDTDEEQEISTQGIPIMPEGYDFEALQPLRELTDAEKVAESLPASVNINYDGVLDIESAVDRMMKRYLTDDLPILIEKSMVDILKQYGVIKSSSILVTGTLEDIGLNSVLMLVADQQLTGKLFVLAMGSSAEIYFDNGLVVFALTSKRGKALTLARVSAASGLSAENLIAVHEDNVETLSMITDLKEGSFFFEKMSLPAALRDVPQRKSISALLLEVLRRNAREAGNEGRGNRDSVYAKAMSGAAARDCQLTDEEWQIFSLADGEKNAATISAVSRIELAQTLMILDRLARARVLRDQGGF